MRNQENISDQMTLTSKLEAVEQKLLKLQSLKDETLSEFTSLLTECKKLYIYLYLNYEYVCSTWINPSFEPITSHEHYGEHHFPR
jgi:hypothetical protein